MSDADKKFVDLHAPYANDGKQNGQRVSEKRTETAPAPVTLVGQGVKVLGEGEVADHRKHGNGTDVSDELAFAAPKRSQDLHPSNTYQGDGDEVDESEWD
ncbi:hypothetical protein TeGR_g7101 [Tetraparma gracilis]|uniref:Uncharacterized protein n=1 Tax=Tetraparma gracilis TaxID=2962635 RepID=A0ABQ6MXK2_9STRA|nr:hypothetical protein TeGR_g7101 [Tetraparma gracilis]